MYFLINIPFALAAAVPAVGVQQRCLRLMCAFVLDLKKRSCSGEATRQERHADLLHAGHADAAALLQEQHPFITNFLSGRFERLRWLNNLANIFFSL